MYTKIRQVHNPKKSVIIVDSFAYPQLYFLFVSILLLLCTKNKSWEPYNRQLDIVIDNRNFESLEDTFLVMFTSNDAIEMGSDVN